MRATYNDGLQDLLCDRRQDSLVVILAQAGVQFRQFLGRRSEENTQGDVDRLQIWWKRKEPIGIDFVSFGLLFFHRERERERV